MLDRITHIWPESIILLPVLQHCGTVEAFKEQATQIVPSLKHLIQYFTKVVHHQYETCDSVSLCQHIEDTLHEKEKYATRMLQEANHFLSASWLRLFVVQVLNENPDIPAAYHLQQTLMCTTDEPQLVCRHTESIRKSQRIEQKRILMADGDNYRPSHKRFCMGTETVLYKIELNALCDQARHITQKFLTVAQSSRFGLDGWLWASDPQRQPPLPQAVSHHLVLTTVRCWSDLEGQQRQAIEDSYQQIFLFLGSLLCLYEQLFRQQRLFRMCVFHGHFSTLEQCIITYHLHYTLHVLSTMLILLHSCIFDCTTRERQQFITNLNTALFDEQ